MGIVSGIVVYILLWWWVLFMLLPIKANAPDNPDIGHATSAPKIHIFFINFLLPQLYLVLLWILTYYIISNNFFTL